VAFVGAVPEGLKQSQRVTTRLLFESKKNVLKAPRGGFLESEGARRLRRRRIDRHAARDRDRRRERRRGGDRAGLKEGDRIVGSDTAPFERARNVMLR
jgi:hypothetical protein